MKISTLHFIPLIGILVFTSPPANSSQISLEYCQKVSDKIRYYTSLRKMGGSPKTMENWKQQRKKYKEKFINRNCKKWRSQLNK